jgi:hypothetical protein
MPLAKAKCLIRDREQKARDTWVAGAAELAEAVERFELEPDDRRKKDALVEASSGSSTSSG